MAEGGSIDVPKVGAVPKKVLIPIGLGAAAFIGWRYWKASQAPAADATPSIQDGDFGAIDTTVPDTLNPYPSSFYGTTGTTTTTTGDRDGDGIIGPGEFTNNGQWTDYVVSKLQQSDTWTYSDIVTALGNGLAGKPTTDTQQAILRAAIAVGGQPPTGALTIISGGNTALTVAPVAQRATSSQTTAAVYFSPVAGAASYQVFRDGASTAVATGAGSPVTVSGLVPNVQYSFQVAGVTSAGTVGPKSNTVKVRTTSYALARASTPSVSAVTATTAAVRTGTVANATEYLWFNQGTGALITMSVGPTATLSGLRPGTRYSVAVAAHVPGQNAGARSAAASFTTKKK